MVDSINDEVPVVRITPELIEAAKKKAIRVKSDPKKLNEFTYRDQGDGLEFGCLAEAIFESRLSHYGIHKWSNNNTTVLDYTVDGIRLEIKSKDRTVPPKLHYACTVSEYNIDYQKVDYYYFVSFERDRDALPDDEVGSRSENFIWPHSAYLVGAASTHFIQTHARPLKKGERDGENMVIKFDCRNIYIEHTIAEEGFFIKVLGGVNKSRRYGGKNYIDHVAPV